MPYTTPHPPQSTIPPFYTAAERTNWVMRNNCHSPLQNLPYRAQRHPGTRADWAVFGCSNTWGSALPETALWHSRLPGTVQNWAVPGTGTDAVLLQAVMARRQHQWRSTIVLLPNIRREIVRYRLPGGSWCTVPIEAHHADWDSSVWGQWCRAQQFPESWLEHNRRHYNRRSRTMILQSRDRRCLRLLARLRRLLPGPIAVSSHDPETYRLLESNLSTSEWQLLPFFRRTDLATDGRHAGPRSHELFAEQILPLLQNW